MKHLMKKFLALYMIPLPALDEMMKNSTPEQMKEVNESWKTWMEKHQANFVDMGLPLGKNKRVMSDGVKDMRNEMTGYSIVQAETHDEAAQIFLDNPQMRLPGSYVEVVECLAMPGM
jgi:hypothetical protein